MTAMARKPSMSGRYRIGDVAMLRLGSIQSLVECADAARRRDSGLLWSTRGTAAPIGRRFCGSWRIAIAPRQMRHDMQWCHDTEEFQMTQLENVQTRLLSGGCFCGAVRYT